MAIPDERLYEYAVVRYVPRVDREEFVNIGLIMMCKRRKWLLGRVLLDPARIMAFDPRADIAALTTQASLFTRADVPSRGLPVEERFRWLSAVKSAVLQVSPPHPGLLPADVSPEQDALEKEFDRLFANLITT